MLSAADSDGSSCPPVASTTNSRYLHIFLGVNYMEKSMNFCIVSNLSSIFLNHKITNTRLSQIYHFIMCPLNFPFIYRRSKIWNDIIRKKKTQIQDSCGGRGSWQSPLESGPISISRMGPDLGRWHCYGNHHPLGWNRQWLKSYIETVSNGETAAGQNRVSSKKSILVSALRETALPVVTT